MPTTNSWGNTVAAAGVTFNGGVFAAGTDATSGAINIGTGAAARTTTIGNTTGASILALKYGTGDFTLASATGTVMSALDTGEVRMPLQPYFKATGATVNDVTGNGTLYTIVFATELIDRNSDYDGTSTFTAPLTGAYLFTFGANLNDWASNITQGSTRLSTSNQDYDMDAGNWYVNVTGNEVNRNYSKMADMDAGDITKVQIYQSNGSKQVNFIGGSFSGILLS